MNANDINPDNPIDLPPSAYHLGRDGEGHDHYHDAQSHRVWVIRDGQLVHERDIGQHIREWVEHIHDQHGWEELNLDERGPFAGLADDLRDQFRGVA